MRALATTLLIASPWLALIVGLGVVGGTFPGWYLLALAAAVLAASAVLAGIARGMSDHAPWDCPDEVDS